MIGIGIKTLPCSTCKAECCGPVRLTPKRFAAILEYLRRIPWSERKVLKRQSRKAIDCHFIDTRDHSCSIYELRPPVCQFFGRVPGLVCPKVGELVQIIPTFRVETEMLKEFEGVNEKSGVMSNTFNWKDL